MAKKRKILQKICDIEKLFLPLRPKYKNTFYHFIH